MFMCAKEVLVQNQVGLHARPATFFIQKANEFKSSIWVEKEERRVNAKSLLGVLSLGIVGGVSIPALQSKLTGKTGMVSTALRGAFFAAEGKICCLSVPKEVRNNDRTGAEKERTSSKSHEATLEPGRLPDA